jgi:hypothetical protein
MLLLTARYSPTTGWDTELNPALDSDNTLLIIFGGTDADQLVEGFADLRAMFPLSLWIGCGTAGEIYQGSLDDDTLVVAVMKFTRTTLRLASSPIHQPEASAQVGQLLAAQLAEPDLHGVFIISDGLSVNGSELCKGLSENLPPHVIVTGGLAGDGASFKQTWVLANKIPQPQQVVAVGFYGKHIRMKYGSRGGWDVLGPEREVTCSKANVLYTLDDQPALSLYKKYLGDQADALPAAGLRFPLAIRNDLEEDGLTMRTILSVNEAEQSITFAGDIPQGKFVRLMRTNFERLIDGAADAVDQMDFSDYENESLLTVAISCVGRRLVLSQRTDEEIDAVLDCLPSEGKLIGFYSYGELSPLKSGRCDLHNQTMTLTSFWENE